MSTEKIYGEFPNIIVGDVTFEDVTVENLHAEALLGTERVIDGTFSVAGLGNWVLGAGWSDGTGKAAKAADGVGTLTQAVAIAAVVGTTYKIVYQVLDVTVNGVTITYGGVSDATKLADGTYTFYATATTTGSLILTPSSNASRFSIDNVSVKALTNATGDLTVDGNLEVRSPVTFRDGLTLSNGQILLANGSVTAPSLSFASGTGTGFYYNTAGYVYLSFNSNRFRFAPTELQCLSDSFELHFGGGADAVLIRDAADTFAMRRTTYPQTFKLYETYTDVNNYERYALIAGSNQLEIKAETLGTGADNLNIVLTPAGIGKVSINGSLEVIGDSFYRKAGNDGTFYFGNDNVGYGVSFVSGGSTRAFLSYDGKFGIGTQSPSQKLSVWDGSIDVADPATLSATCLSEGNFATHAEWDITGDFDDTGGNATYLHNTGAGTLIQTPLAIALKGNRWYKFVYTVSGVVGTTTAVIPATVATTETSLVMTNGVAKVLYFKTINAPTFFQITGGSDAALEAFVLDDLALYEVQGGDIHVGGKILLGDGSVTAPSLAFSSNTTLGFYNLSGAIRMGINNTRVYTFDNPSFAIEVDTAQILLGVSLDVRFLRDAADTLAMRRTTNPQTFKLYETYTDADNYERYALIAGSNQLEIKAETLGDGADNLDIALTPAGTGNVKFGTYGAEVALVAGYITIKDAAGNLRKLAVIA
jgi:hypothetical protein